VDDLVCLFVCLSVNYLGSLCTVHPITTSYTSFTARATELSILFRGRRGDCLNNTWQEGCELFKISVPVATVAAVQTATYWRISLTELLLLIPD